MKGDRGKGWVGSYKAAASCAPQLFPDCQIIPSIPRLLPCHPNHSFCPPSAPPPRITAPPPQSAQEWWRHQWSSPPPPPVPRVPEVHTDTACPNPAPALQLKEGWWGGGDVKQESREKGKALPDSCKAWWELDTGVWQWVRLQRPRYQPGRGASTPAAATTALRLIGWQGSNPRVEGPISGRGVIQGVERESGPGW